MENNIAFIGGIHGVGKSTICGQICKEIKLEYLSASDLLKWKEINDDSQNKKVENIPVTQDRLIIGLKNTIKKNKSYLLDGHYCLLNGQNEIINVPLDTFKKINPVYLSIVLGDISEIKSRLEKRDNKPYDIGLLNLMQESELNYATYLAKTFDLILYKGTQHDFSEILASLHKHFLIDENFT